MRPAGWLCVLMCACGAGAPASPPPPIPTGTTNQVLLIVNYTFTPQHLVATPGSTVLILNEDPFPHTVTSAAAAGTYVFGSVAGIAFDAWPAAAVSTTPGTQGLSIPADATPGTVIPYFCRFHGAADRDQGDITITTP